MKTRLPGRRQCVRGCANSPLSLGYSFAFIPNVIGFGAYKRTIVAGIIDGIVFGVITGAIFAWRWPH